MADSDNAAFISGDPGSRIHRKGTSWQVRMRKEMAEIKPGQLALERAETQRDLLQDIFCCFWMLGLSPREEPTRLRSACVLGETEVCFSPPPGLQRESGGTAGLQPQPSHGEDAAGSGMKLSGCFAINLLLLPAWPATRFPWWRWGSGGATPTHSSKGDATREGGFAAVSRLEKSRAPGQTDGLCSPPGSSGPSPNDFPATSRVTVVVRNEVLPLSGWKTSHIERRSCGKFGFLLLLLLPSPLQPPPPRFPPTRPTSCAVGKETAPGKHAGLNFHLGTV